MRILAMVLGLAALATVAAADPLVVGGLLPPLVTEDQHGARAEVDARTRVLLVSHDMDGGDVVKQALAEAPSGFLDRRHVAYVADISRMPAMISKLFAVPKMRQRPYRVFLDRDGALTRDLPREKDRVTVVTLEALRITAIEQLAAPAALRAALDRLPE